MTKWCIWFPERQQYLGHKGKARWTTDRAEADQMAERFPGAAVVTAEELARIYKEAQLGETTAHEKESAAQLDNDERGGP